MRRLIIVSLLVLSAVAPARSWAWGCVGHQVVAYIASQNLNPAAADNVKQLLSGADYGKVRFCAPTNLGDIEKFATWADDTRTDANAGWHFWDIPLATDTASMPTFCPDPGCVVSAIKAHVAVLQDPSQPLLARQQALLFVIHLVGDEHQPMHIVDNGDRGGNCVPVSFVFKGQSKKTVQEKNKAGVLDGSYSPNLHSIWDDNIIETMTGVQNASNRDMLTQNFADSVIASHKDEITSAAGLRVNFDTDIESWALATHKLAKRDSYDPMPKALPVDPSPQTITSCQGVSSKFVPLHEKAQGKYITDAQPVIQDQLALAGGRLAGVLNTIWPSAQ